MRHCKSGTTIFYAFCSNYPTALFLYHMWIPDAKTLSTYIWNVLEVEVVVSISVSVIFFVHVPGVICMMCCTWYVFAVARKVKKASSAQNRGLPTKHTEVYIIYIFECSRSRKEVWKPRVVMPGTWCRVWFIVRVCATWCIIHKWLSSYERFILLVRDTCYLVHNMAAA